MLYRWAELLNLLDRKAAWRNPEIIPFVGLQGKRSIEAHFDPELNSLFHAFDALGHRFGHSSSLFVRFLCSLGSDRFRIFSAQAKGAFQCQEISPRVRFALEQSGESRRQVRDALGAGEAKDRHELGAVGLGMVLRQVGEGSAGWRAGATRGDLAPVDPVPAARRLDHPGEIQSSKQASLPAQVALGLIAEALAQTIQESLTAEEPSMPCLGPRGGQAG